MDYCTSVVTAISYKLLLLKMSVPLSMLRRATMLIDQLASTGPVRATPTCNIDSTILDICREGLGSTELDAVLVAASVEDSLDRVLSALAS